MEADIEYLVNGSGCDVLVIFAHGAGANMHSEFMEQLAQGVGANDVQVVRFNFPYMRANVLDGKRRPPDRAVKIILDFNQQIKLLKNKFCPKKVILMGKSMGGRMSAIVAADTSVDGVICLGYPFIPLKGGDPRLAPIVECAAPLLVVQGERDKFGNKGAVNTWPEMEKVNVHWLTDGDHSFKPRKASGLTLEANMALAIAHCQQFIEKIKGS
ncbi:dienelactone hydrolase family protein [Shewanella surugensis]|uniref:Dienelactone hydrolase family protein n=1 Tax=Shewanella surugensis TaxID=212020 RepID=A0ABT0LEA0_9GAMM|nr:alpha/beta fold hydrolase [Shewanella surugensis]MCL1126031.1 dienelactone hydrolase family protein [Shewanella surugensis]